MFGGLAATSNILPNGRQRSTTNSQLLSDSNDERARLSVVNQRNLGLQIRQNSAKNNYVHIIVSGYKFTTLSETLARFPESRLGDEKQRKEFWDKERMAYVFNNRCRQSFESILYFYQSNGHLVQPPNVDQERFMKQVIFFKLPIQDALKSAEIDSGFDTVQNISHIPRRLQKLMEYKTRRAFFVLSVLDCATTIIYVAIQLAKTTPQFHMDDDDFLGGYNHYNFDLPAIYGYVHRVAYFTEIGCVTWFTILYILRLITTKNKQDYVCKFMNIIEVIVVMSYLANMALHEILPHGRVTSTSGILIPVSALMTINSFLRLFNIARYSELLYCLGIALKRSLADLAQVIFVIILLTFLFATLAYFIEEEGGRSQEKRTFLSVFDALYWGTITISTVGYGDIAPQTTGGKFVGAALALMGLPLIAIPMPLIMSKFDNYYQNVKRRKKTNELSKKLMEEVAAGIESGEQYDPEDDRRDMSWIEMASEAYDYGLELSQYGKMNTRPSPNPVRNTQSNHSSREAGSTNGMMWRAVPEVTISEVERV